MMRRVILTLTFLALLAVLLQRLATPLGLLCFGVTALLFSLPGFFVGFWLFGVELRRHPESLIFGAVVGLALSQYLVLALGYLVGWSIPILALALLVLALVTFVLTRRNWGAPLLNHLPSWDRTDYAALLLLGILLLSYVALPFLQVGRLTPHGYAYTWLFGFDFLLRSTIAASMATGLPPDYPHLAGNPLRLYLSAYTVPAFAYSLAGKIPSMHSVMYLVQLFNGLLFLACLYSALRYFIRHRGALLLTAIVAMLAYSYYDLYVLAKRAASELGGPWQSFVHRVAPLYFGDVSHLYQRYFLVEFQASMGLCVFVLVWLLLEATRYSVRRPSLGVLLGLLIGVEFGIEGWLGLLLAIWFGCVQVVRWLRRRGDLQPESKSLGVLVGVAAAVYTSFFALGVYSISSGQMIVLRPYWLILRAAPFYLLVEYGPMLVFGLIYLYYRARRDRTVWLTPLSLLGGLTLLVIFFVRAAVLPEMGVLRGHRTLPLVLLVWTGYFFTDFLERPRARSRVVLVAGLLVAAVPTVFTDIYFTSNVNDLSNTVYVNPADRRAAEWIRRNLPEKALMQSEPTYLNYTAEAAEQPYALSLLPNFAERRVVLGEDWIASTILVNARPIVKARSRDIRGMFQATEIESVLAVTDKYGIDYLYVGPYEQRLHPGFLDLLEKYPPQFKEIYDLDGVHIFRLTGAPLLVRSASQEESRQLGSRP